jgi:carbon-monoxide dehydrogenase small subunit/xanthine dehydrogenase small subunit
VRFTLNGKRADVRANPMARLLDVLRRECGLTGTKEGCGEGECGACTVLVDGEPVNSCLVPFAQVRGARVTTIEGLGGAHCLQVAFAEEGAAQCGFCTPGFILAATKLTDGDPEKVVPREKQNVKNPKEAIREIQTCLSGNLCRCTGYTAIYRAIEKARARKTPRKGRKR